MSHPVQAVFEARRANAFFGLAQEAVDDGHDAPGGQGPEAAAVQFAPDGIRVNSVSPGFIGPGAMWERQVDEQAATPSSYYADDPAVVAEQMVGAVPMRRYGSVEEVAAVVRFLLSDESSYLTGSDLEVAGGV